MATKLNERPKYLDYDKYRNRPFLTIAYDKRNIVYTCVSVVKSVTKFR